MNKNIIYLLLLCISVFKLHYCLEEIITNRTFATNYGSGIFKMSAFKDDRGYHTDLRCSVVFTELDPMRLDMPVAFITWHHLNNGEHYTFGPRVCVGGCDKGNCDIGNCNVGFCDVRNCDSGFRLTPYDNSVAYCSVTYFRYKPIPDLESKPVTLHTRRVIAHEIHHHHDISRKTSTTAPRPSPAISTLAPPAYEIQEPASLGPNSTKSTTMGPNSTKSTSVGPNSTKSTTVAPNSIKLTSVIVNSTESPNDWTILIVSLSTLAVISLLASFLIYYFKFRVNTKKYVKQETDNETEMQEIESNYASIPIIPFYEAKRMVASNKKWGEASLAPPLPPRNEESEYDYVYANTLGRH